MATDFFDRALTKVLAHEGGYVNHPSDPGGPTKYGITLATYRQYVKPNATAADVKAMPIAHAKTIYKAKYWDALRCDDLPAGVDYAVFDYGVNSGIGRSGKVLRRILGLPDKTNAITADVLAKIATVNSDQLVIAICDERLAFLKSLRTWPVFGAGWNRRVSEVRRSALAFVKQVAVEAAPAPQPTPAEPELEHVDDAPPIAPEAPTPGKGEVPDAKTTKDVIKGGTATTAGGSGFGFWDWISAHPIETAAIAVLAVLAVGGVIYAINRMREVKQDAPPAGWVPPVLATA